MDDWGIYICHLKAIGLTKCLPHGSTMKDLSDAISGCSNGSLKLVRVKDIIRNLKVGHLVIVSGTYTNPNDHVKIIRGFRETNKSKEYLIRDPVFWKSGWYSCEEIEQDSNGDIFVVKVKQAQ